ncbi:general secretion pathway protein GspF [Salegentibacter salinarum]|uniref:General secretion pathway protein F n=1 Tax=Salegentibacter salinarum TaxID=447422 RepID=A0A2N0TTI6_9FLAO|nr:type II secretion system F family protein [Salegentibacter salinarum]PKD18026.1 general secretion pathway protein GspF [Salegentibacter salinarum]SKB99505.1 type IV pilus assembly protein PilC [Salegentibacter salinarum]
MGIKIDHTGSGNILKERNSLENLLKKEITLFGNTFSGRKKEQFYSELSVLLKSGVDLKNSLELIAESQNKIKDRESIAKINDFIISGNSFAVALECNPNFSPYECKAIKLGEETGEMAFITRDLADYYQKKNDQKRQIISALTYPAIVLCTALVVVFFMLKYVVPMFEDIFEQNNVSLPFLTQLIVSGSHILESYGLLFFFLLVLLIVGWRLVRKKIWYKKITGIFILKIPLFGNYVRKIYITRFIHTMTLLTRAKVPISNGLGMVCEMLDFYPLRMCLQEIEKDILKGEQLSASFKKHPIFDKKIIALLKVAEATNQTEFVFGKLYIQYSQELEYESKSITNIVNPLLTLFVGLIVAVILIAMYLPMFRLSSVIG